MKHSLILALIYLSTITIAIGGEGPTPVPGPATDLLSAKGWLPTESPVSEIHWLQHSQGLAIRTDARYRSLLHHSLSSIPEVLYSQSTGSLILAPDFMPVTTVTHFTPLFSSFHSLTGIKEVRHGSYTQFRIQQVAARSSIGIHNRCETPWKKGLRLALGGSKQRVHFYETHKNHLQLYELELSTCYWSQQGRTYTQQSPIKNVGVFEAGILIQYTGKISQTHWTSNELTYLLGVEPKQIHVLSQAPPRLLVEDESGLSLVLPEQQRVATLLKEARLAHGNQFVFNADTHTLYIAATVNGRERTGIYALTLK